MDKVASLLLIVLACCVLYSDAQVPLGLTSYLSASSNATSSNFSSNSSSPAQGYPAAVLDGLLSTWWVTEEDIQPVSLSLSSTIDFTGFTLSIDIVFISSLPLSIGVINSNSGVLLGLFVTNCSEQCQGLMINGTHVQLAVNGSSGSEINLVFDGFQDNATQFEVSEVTVTGFIMPGYYLPDLESVGVNEENALLINPSGDLSLGYNYNKFPGFYERGFAVSDFMVNQSQFLQLTLIINDTTSFDNLFLRYIRPKDARKHSTWIPATIIQGSLQCNVQFFIDSSCKQTPCYAQANPIDCVGLRLEPGVVNIVTQLEGSQFFLDYIAAVPDAFNSTLNECGLNNNSEYCIDSTLQQSLSLHGLLQECQCLVAEYSCEALGGQCSCETQVGRQCDKCIYTYYLNDTECIPCGCINNTICAENGQCQCESNVTGLQCDRCIDNHFGDPLVGCQECSCNGTGTFSCNSSTGECYCKPNVTGVTCSECLTGHTNFSSDGCQLCSCFTDGGYCSSDGSCICYDGYTGSSCDQCDDSSFLVSNGSCMPCNCSGVTNSCMLADGSSYQELCNCTQGYTGYSCENCSAGYYRHNDSSCVLCTCNNDSLICQDFTGDCLLFPVPPPPVVYPPPLNCTPNTTGELCQYCADEYYNSSITSDLECTKCPCHPNTTINQSCIVENSQPVCFCLDGHEGSLCDICSPSYYGIPPAYPCSDCQCSGNIDTNDPDACNHTTGECINCINNSTGSKCEICQDEFFGNALTQSCEPCGCVASTSPVCNKNSGVCNCRKGVSGTKCTECEKNYWNYSVDGCTPCMCHVNGSSSESCNVTTGECSCNEGVQGLNCDECKLEYYNFTKNGCQECDCGEGAVNNSCHLITGQCHCGDNVMGLQCDKCSKYYHELSSDGCIECDSCTLSLKRKSDSLRDDLRRIDTFIIDAGHLQNADTLNLESLSGVISTLESTYNQSMDNLTKGIDRLNTLTNNTNNIQSMLALFNVEINMLIVDLRNIRNYSEGVLISVINLHNSLVDIGEGELNYTMDFVVNVTDELHQLVNNSSATLLDLQSLTNNLTKEILIDTMKKQAALQNIADIETEVSSSYASRASELSMINSGIDSVNDYYARLMRLDMRIQQLLQSVKNATANYTSENLDLLAAANNVSGLIFDSMILINDSETDLSTVHDRLTNTSIILQQLQITLTDFISSSGSGIDVSFNSQDSIVNLIDELESNVSQLNKVFNQSSDGYESALLNASNIINQSDEFCRIINASLYAGNDAVAAIMDYAFVNETLSLAYQIVVGLNLSDVLNKLEMIMSTELDLSVNELSNSTANLSQNIISLGQRISETILVYNQLTRELNNTRSNVSTGLLQSLNNLSLRYQYVQSVTNVTVNNIMLLLSDALNGTQFINSTYYDKILMLHSSVLDNVTETNEDLIDLSENAIEIDEELLLANATAQHARESFRERVSYLNMINDSRTLLSSEINSASTSIFDLHQQLIEAQKAAALVDIALRFHGNGTATYNLSSSPMSGGTHLSLNFRPESLSGILLTDNESNNNLELEDGEVKWSYGDYEIQTYNLSLSLAEWYQVEASFDESSLFLSVAPIQGNSLNTVTLMTPANSTMPLMQSSVLLAGDADGDFLYTGCIDSVVINGEMLSLLTPNSSTVAMRGCGPRPAAEMPRLLESGAWFQGQSQLSLGFIDFDGDGLDFSFAFRTFSASSQFLTIQNMNNHTIILLYVDEGLIHMRLSLGMDVRTSNSSVVVTDGYWHHLQVSINVASLRASLIIDDVASDISLGSFASNVTSPISVRFGGTSWLNVPSFSGCVANFSLNDMEVNFSASEVHVAERVEVSNCPSFVSPSTRFMGTGTALFSMTGWLDSVSFEFKTHQISSVLLDVTGLLPDRLLVTLFHTYLRVEIVNTFNDIVLTSMQNNLNDGQPHHVNISLVDDNIILTVDEESRTASTANNTNYLLLLGSVTVGGPAVSARSIITDYYRGCLSNLRINSEEYDFNNAQLSEGVALFGCHELDETTPPPPPPTISPSGSGSGFGSGDSIISIIPPPTTSESSSAVIPTMTGSSIIPSPTEISTVSPSPTEISTVLPSSTEISTVLPSSTEISTVSPSSTEISPVSPSSTEISTVSPSSTESSTVLPSSTEISTVSPSSTEISPVSPSSTDISTVSPSSIEISTVLPSSIKISTVSPSLIEISTVSPSSTEISAVSPSSTESSTVSPSSTEISIVSPSSTEISTVSPSSTEISTVSPSSTEISTVSPSSTEISAVSPSSTESSTVSPSSTEISAVSPSSTESSTVSPSTTEISTVLPSSTEISTVLPSSTEISTVSPSPTEILTVSPSSTESSTVSPSSTEISEVSPSSTESSTVSPSSTESSTVSPTMTPTPVIDPVGLNGQEGSFLSYSLPSDITFSSEITLTFRTGSSNALLIYTQSAIYNDYMALELRNGAIYYSYNLGAGSIFINSVSALNRYDDNMNHTVTITRNGTRGALIVDGTEYTGVSYDTHDQLNTNAEPIYIGGVSGIMLSSLHLYSDQSLVPSGAEACFYHFSVNGEIINLRAPSAASGLVDTCQDEYNDYLSFLGSGYATLVNVYRPLVAYEFRLEFRTVHCSGLLLYSSSLLLEDHTALEISEGKVRFIFDNGHGPGVVEYVPANLSSLCDGNWHRVIASKSGVIGSLTIDGQASVSTTLSSTGFISVNTDSPLYAGGVPNNVLVRYTVTAGSFQGCLNNIQLVDSDDRITTSIDPSDIETYSNVLLNTCNL